MAFLVILFFFGLAGGVVGRLKGSSFFIWFLISFCVPFIGLAAAVLYRFENEELRRQCPGCGKVVKLHDALCTRCGAELEFPDTVIASERRVAEARAAREAGPAPAAHAGAGVGGSGSGAPGADADEAELPR